MSKLSQNLLLITLPLYLLDQLTKWLVVAYLNPSNSLEGYTVIPNFFNIVSVVNTGAAFGMFRNNNAMFIILSIIAVVGIFIVYRAEAKRGSALVNLGLCLLLAGVLGNLTDRILRGHVVDFLQFDLHIRGANPWPSFNIADSCICIAAACFVFNVISQSSRRVKNQLI